MRKEPKPFIRFYSLEPGTVTLFPIVKSTAIDRKFLSQSQVGDQPETLSSKNCPGIKKIVSSGWIVPAPADFSILTNGDGVSFDWGEPYRFTKITPGMDAYVNSHTRSQTEPLLDNENTTLKTVVKIETPWRVEASDDTILLLMPVTYNNESRFSAATGILDPKYGHVLNIQLFWKVLNGATVIKAGTPLCQIIPISRKALSKSYYDVIIDVATDEDAKKEQEFNYASNCTFLANDSLSSRLSRVIAVLNKYKTRG
ncbi:hypothetical protein UFOVP181_369 [uncultured Caudovirales phage]|uniref:Uncharacterized protein n=1 Tax=uncultured Caudovirales phage TaxID=2100421 RepID=A0A6J5L1C1_9CAUD|nr:hypothetical protein UFOVP57_270 [uncultured Caudovirales phage]CAB5209230.1 hypothetical protein UFOVP181_369 [uncultured Caudovirales phage]